MAKSEDSYQACLDEIRAKTTGSSRSNGKPSRSVSKSDLEKITHQFLNSPSHTVTDYAYSNKDTSGTGKPVGIDTQPAKRYRDSLKPMLRKLGLDNNDVQAVDSIPMDREHAAAMINLAGHVMHDYMRAGRKYVLPMTEPDETRMELYMQPAPERVSVGNRFRKDENSEDTVSVTRERTILRSKNGVPYWLRSKD